MNYEIGQKCGTEIEKGKTSKTEISNSAKRQMKIFRCTERNFQKTVLESEQPVVLICEAEWSGDAHIMAPIIEDLVECFNGKIRFGKLDFEKYATLAERYCTRQSLTFLFFKDGRMVNLIQGTVLKTALKKQIEMLLK